MTPLQRYELNKEIEQIRKEDGDWHTLNRRRQDRYDLFIEYACIVLGIAIGFCFVALMAVHTYRLFHHG